MQRHQPYMWKKKYGLGLSSSTICITTCGKELDFALKRTNFRRLICYLSSTYDFKLWFFLGYFWLLVKMETCVGFSFNNTGGLHHGSHGGWFFHHRQIWPRLSLFHGSKDPDYNVLNSLCLKWWNLILMFVSKEFPIFFS